MTVDFSKIYDDAEIAERESIMAEMNSAQELDAMADMIEAKDIETEHEEFIENLRYVVKIKQKDSIRITLEIIGGIIFWSIFWYIMLW